jgi:D-alanine-D-alanine ligase
MKTRIGLVFGGRSGEHEVSIRSAARVIRDIDKSRFSVLPIAIDQNGSWLDPITSLTLLPPSAADLISDDACSVNAESIALIGDPRYKGLKNLTVANSENSLYRIDVFFPVLHGTFGEDGTIQGLFEMADVPYVGCGVLSSACGMDKVAMKQLFAANGLPICSYVWFLRSQWERMPDGIVKMVEEKIGYPCFVKPANLGSSVGVSMAADAEHLKTAIAKAAEYDRKIIVEEALQMREIECAVMGNENPQASTPGEYIIRNKQKAFLDYTEKYSGTGNNEFVTPAPVSEELAEKIREYAVAAFKAIDGSGLSRVDFFLRTDNGALLVNEINTMPGLTEASGFPKMWAASGLEFTEVISRLIDLAVEKHQEKAKNKTYRDD